ncbi:MAG: hypothetical protein RRB13_10490 [bacterium]|nr:hypothetical protein [bacterium]
MEVEVVLSLVVVVVSAALSPVVVVVSAALSPVVVVVPVSVVVAVSVPVPSGAVVSPAESLQPLNNMTINMRATNNRTLKNIADLKSTFKTEVLSQQLRISIITIFLLEQKSFGLKTAKTQSAFYSSRLCNNPQIG